jgi:ABC-type bacteriocin/lantibiotic exporter with double-glycine peptidase domain
LLDEPSSSLDPEAENRIFKSIEKLCAHKTVIFTSHRFSNLYLADKIFVIENGKVVESGTQSELLFLNQRFAHLFRLQEEKFKLQSGANDAINKDSNKY